MNKVFFFFIAVAAFTSCATQRNATNCSTQNLESITRLQLQVDSLINALQEIKIPDSLVNNGAMGDIKYSILSVNAFQKENGFCWQLLDSTYNFAASELFKKYSSVLPSKLPDGRGVFIRGMMTDTSEQARNYGDPEGKRDMGSYQSDQIKSHRHKFIDHVYSENSGGNRGLLGVRGSGNSDRDNGPESPWPSITDNQEEGVKETRPRNIALFIYIKVCNEQ